LIELLPRTGERQNTWRWCVEERSVMQMGLAGDAIDTRAVMALGGMRLRELGNMAS